MVVLCAAITTKAGKPLLSRQFIEMSRMRVEGLLAAFPKLVNSPPPGSGSGGKQHTFVETDAVRYVYQPVEALYILLVTTRGSNIVEDLETLRLLSKVVPDVAGGLHESHINDSAFELLFSLDEVLSAGGHKEEASLSTIRTSLAMESHEEKMHMMLKESKEKAAREEMQKKAKEIQDRNMKAMKDNFMNNGMSALNQQGQGGAGGMSGFGGGGGGGAGGMGGLDQQFGMGGNGVDPYGQSPYMAQAEPEQEPAPRVATKGMKLVMGGAKKKDSMLAAMAAEDNLAPLSIKKKKASSASAAAAASVAPSTPVSIVAEEKVTVALNREGAVEQSDIKGTLSLVANTPEGADVHVVVNKDILKGLGAGWTFATHPKVSKPSYEKQGLLKLKASGPGKGFPIGRPVGILRWGYSASDGAPITINCWPEEEGGNSINVNIEYELSRDMTLEDVDIMIPLGTTDAPDIQSIDGNYKHNPRDGVMLWHFDRIDQKNSSGSLEFTISGSDTDAFFPISVSFSSKNLLCPVDVRGVTSGESGAQVGYAVSKMVVPESYRCA
eukprot:CAMPEP_0194287022 /NCGR_PEP_ID=MMETSP0169-20130528/33839_1 /TAXON_ID=218684 /ORGANISM="Corethron pennatum, Strain L29A3" /LENGTH=552 /DNA_ID=CAMNT_0039033599 /DNA_START=187 /DNA_END=1845 /DNA_ORIENTATION=-